MDLLKILQPGYKLPTRKQISTTFLQNEIVHVDRNIKKIIDTNENLTLGKLLYLILFIYCLIN